MVPGVSLAQLCHAARAADPAAPYGLSLRTSLLASIVHSGALSKRSEEGRLGVNPPCNSLKVVCAHAH